MNAPERLADDRWRKYLYDGINRRKLEMHEFGEGTVRIDHATTHMIEQARHAQKKWGLTNKALKIVLERVLDAEETSNYHGVMNSKDAIAADLVTP